jgi:hypothetical protein
VSEGMSDAQVASAELGSGGSGGVLALGTPAAGGGAARPAAGRVGRGSTLALRHAGAQPPLRSQTPAGLTSDAQVGERVQRGARGRRRRLAADQLGAQPQLQLSDAQRGYDVAVVRLLHA